jgi:hypothetical protein
MNKKKAVLLGCGAITLIAVAIVVVIVLFVAHVSKDVEGVAVTINGTTDVTVGQTFDLEVVVKNERSGKALALSDVDLSDEYLAGFTVAKVTPAAKSSTHVPIARSQSFTFDMKIPAGASQTFVFTLRAEKAGIYRGDLDVWEGSQSITSMAQTVVKNE